MKEIRQTFNNAENAFQNLLPKPLEDWRRIYPLDVMFRAESEEELEDFRSNWESFLEQLDKTWNRLNAFAKHHIKDQSSKNSILGYLGQVNDKRKKDDLLVYLDKARNSAHHTLWRHIRQSDRSEVITDAKGVHIDIRNGQLNLTSPNGGTVSEIVVLNNYVVLLSAVEVVEKKKDYLSARKTFRQRDFPFGSSFTANGRTKGTCIL